MAVLTFDSHNKIIRQNSNVIVIYKTLDKVNDTGYNIDNIKPELKKAYNRLLNMVPSPESKVEKVSKDTKSNVNKNGNKSLLGMMSDNWKNRK